VKSNSNATTDAGVRDRQVWADNDPRSAGRKVRVISVDETHATVVGVVASGGKYVPSTAARKTRIKLTRFKPTSTGYRLVQDAED
jgi:hypothetical protein